MSTEQAQSAVSISALIVASIYAYRKLTETVTGGTVTAAPWPHFVLGFGFVYVSLAVVAQAAPELGGMFAILVAAGDVLANGQSVIGDVQTSLKDTGTGKTSTSSTGSASHPAAGTASAQQVNTATGA